MKGIKTKTFTMTPELFKKNSKRALNEEKLRLVDIIKKEKAILEDKEECLNQIEYWENMLK